MEDNSELVNLVPFLRDAVRERELVCVQPEDIDKPELEVPGHHTKVDHRSGGPLPRLSYLIINHLNESR